MKHSTMLSKGAMWLLVQAVSSQQLQEAHDVAAGLHVQLANLKASQQQVQANQVHGTVASQWYSLSTLNPVVLNYAARRRTT